MLGNSPALEVQYQHNIYVPCPSIHQVTVKMEKVSNQNILIKIST